ncbi:hypothetical protein POV27_02830 [Aureisphaera galaxeae]|uniref:hypothetical protein n=1 Tax=Aureisphaera galaxeae TaxID=1538023 RepID=UPI002350E5E3|nr:hypothetical protein [Aureisphaera galaxeae]MDC8002967.1 hypothetical protein [Aureisphaera galaxeae]
MEKSSPKDLERIWYSVLKISKGSEQELLEAIKLAQTDWRDLFMAAGFGRNIFEHKSWAKEVINTGNYIA